MCTIQTNQLLEEVTTIARQAGELARGYFRCNPKVTTKSDNTLLSEADTRLDAHIRQHLSQLTPDIPIISEESPVQDSALRATWPRTWLVDPLDGTRHFVDGKPDYTVNIALIEGNTPVLGVIYAPSHRRVYVAARGQGAWGGFDKEVPRRLRCRIQGSCVQVMVSHGVPGWRLRSFLSQTPGYELTTLGSSLKSCWIAEGYADIYPRFGVTFEWDTAAGQVILQEAGGGIYTSDGKPLVYNKTNLQNPEFVACAGWYQPPGLWY